MRTRPLTPRLRRIGGWHTAALALVALGVLGSWLIARAVAANHVAQARSAFRLGSAQIASTLRLAIQRENDLVAGASAFVVEHPQASEAAFNRWARDEHVLASYPELLGLSEVVVVPARGLAAFEARQLAQLPRRPGHARRYVVVPPGRRPFYCLTAVSLSIGSAAPPGTDWCLTTPGTIADRDSGHGSAYTIGLGPGLPSALGVGTPVYRGGTIPATLVARRREFIGIVGMAVVPAELLGSALQGHRGIVAVLVRSGGAGLGMDAGGRAPSFASGRIPHGATRLVTDLYGHTAVTTYTVLPAAGILGASGALATLAGGLTLTLLLSALVFVLGTGRARALRLVEERTRALNEALARFEAVYRDAPIGIGIVDLDARFTETTNSRLRGLYRTDELAGSSIVELALEEDRKAIRAGFQRLLDGACETWAGEHRLDTGNPRPTWVLASFSLVRDDSHAPSFAVAMVEDITEQKLAELDRQRREVETRMHQKLEAVGQLAAGIAHEMNTPIQFVGDSVRFLDDSFGDLLGLLAAYREALARPDAGEDRRHALAQAEEEADIEYVVERAPQVFERIYNGVERVATLVAAMKDFAHSSQVEKQPADVNAAIRTTLTVARNEYKYVAEVVLELGELPQLVCNISDLGQVFLNLIVNAAHAIEDAHGGETDAKGTITIRTRAEPDAVVVEVADDGCGIAPEIRDRIFDPFFTTKEVGRGTGQGLAIAYGIVVERHGGAFQLTSEPGVGTTFTIRLPLESPGETAALAQAA